MQQDKLKKNFIVVKFGGSNFRNLDGYGEVIHKIFELLNIAYNKKIVVVVSASYGVTDRLLKALKEFKLLDVKLFIEEIYYFHSSFLGVRDDEELRRIVFGLEGLFYGLKFLGKIREVSKSISDAGLNIKFVITSQTAINLIISKNDVFDVLRVVERMRTKELEDISYDTDKALVSVVGYGLFDTHGIAAKIFGILANAQINVEMISAGVLQVSMYFLVDVKDGRRGVELIHNALFSGK